MTQFAAIPIRTLNPEKFRDPLTTAQGEARAHVALVALRTLWVNTGTLCNLACANCYIESSPRNDRLAYLTRAELQPFLAEIARENLPTEVIGFSGGEPFMNRDLPGMLEDTLAAGLRALVLTNAMAPMRKMRDALLELNTRYPGLLTIRVSLDHYAAPVHEAERGKRSFAPSIAGLVWLAEHGFDLHVASRTLSGEPEAVLRAGFARLFASLGVPIDAADPVRLMIFPEMDASRDVPEITEACWGILGRSPESVMCATSRMLVKRKGAARPAVLACTLLPYDPRFELGATLADASGPVALNHPHCASFCVLGGAACSRA